MGVTGLRKGAVSPFAGGKMFFERGAGTAEPAAILIFPARMRTFVLRIFNGYVSRIM